MRETLKDHCHVHIMNYLLCHFSSKVMRVKRETDNRVNGNDRAEHNRLNPTLKRKPSRHKHLVGAHHDHNIEIMPGNEIFQTRQEFLTHRMNLRLTTVATDSYRHHNGFTHLNAAQNPRPNPSEYTTIANHCTRDGRQLNASRSARWVSG
jgi:hypothetical protein